MPYAISRQAAEVRATRHVRRRISATSMSISDGPAVKNSIRSASMASITAAGLNALWM